MELDVHALKTNVFEDLNHRWMVIGATDGERANAMTAGWGGGGVLWEENVFFIAVRPCRYTYEILENTKHCTLSFFGDEYRKELTYLGRTSGRDENKLQNSALSPIVTETDVYFSEAKLVLSGEILAKVDLTGDSLCDKTLEKFYPKKDYHRIYVFKMTRAWTQND